MTIYLPAGSFILPACLHFKSLQAAVEKVKTACDYICLQAVKWKKSKLPLTISACRQFNVKLWFLKGSLPPVWELPT